MCERDLCGGRGECYVGYRLLHKKCEGEVARFLQEHPTTKNGSTRENQGLQC